MMSKEEVEHCIRWKLDDVFRNYSERESRPEKVIGTFRLNDEDERKYLDRKAILEESGFTTSLNELYSVDKLLPLSPWQDVDCAFSQFAKRRGISLNDSSRCHFQIAKNQDFKLYEIEIPHQNSPIDKLGNTDTISTHARIISKNENRIESLNQFIQWLEVRVDIDRNNLDCTKEELFDFLKCWERDRTTKINQRVWDVKGWDSCGDLWSSDNRRQVCDIADDRRGRKIVSPYKIFFNQKQL